MNPYEKENLSKLYPGLSECTVLLKKDGAFPLGKAGRIAAYGSGVRHTIKGGTGSGEVNSRYFITAEQGLKDAGFELTTKEWLDAYDEVLAKAHEQFVRDIKARAKAEHKNAVLIGMGAVMAQPEYELALDGGGDACIYVLSRTSGEGNDRADIAGDFLLTGTEQRDILKLNEKFEKFMLVLNTGGPVDLTPVMGVKNILVLSQLGVETGKVLADILLGKTYPSGKLTSTWSQMKDYPDVGTFGEINDSLYKEGIYVGYRWFDAVRKKAEFPFGWGLGYTDFEVKDPDISVNRTVVTVSAVIDNIGSYSGKETLQIYVSCAAGKLDKPVKDLAAFAKSDEIAPGESAQVQASFDMRQLSSYDEETASYILERGRYTVLIGSSSVNLKYAGSLELEEDIIVRKVKNLLGSVDFADWKPEKEPEDVRMPEGCRTVRLKAADFRQETVDYRERTRICDEIEELGEDELCHMVMGAFDPKGGLASVIGSASLSVAGAAGETAAVMKDLPVLVMADGPAGVRISEKYYVDKKGVHSYGSSMPETFLEFMSGPAKLFMGGTPKLPKGAELKEQYCTAIPIGTALAQSWNPEFAELCGDVVGSEMELFGIDLWLAPALNIHRNPLCGRNFEYYSEDPLISGIFAAAVTGGVQSHRGRGVTIKHYAANNQETNRYFTNSAVSERAMREIYLKGFAICIRKAHPAAVMTSYNLLNGIHTSENRALCTDILRSEFGFDGICMTDWVVNGLAPARGSKYNVPEPAKVAAAGGDLFMPGSKKDYEHLKSGLREGKVTVKQLKINAEHMMHVTIAFI